MLNAHDIHKSFKNRKVLKGASLSLKPGEIATLIGKNGSGKTTLLQILAGETSADKGRANTSNTPVGYLCQELQSLEETAREYLSDRPPWEVERAKEVMGINTIDMNQKISELSGGERTKLQFLKIITDEQESKYLLLDEPTNNLDKEGKEWLKLFLKNYDGGVLMASHDRTFINEVTDNILELKDGEISVYGGDYDFYKEQKEIERKTQRKRYKENVRKRKQLAKELHDAKDRARHGAKSPPRDNDKSLYKAKSEAKQKTFAKRAKAIKSRIDRLEEVERPETPKEYSLEVEGASHGGKLIARLEGINHSFASNIVLRDASLEIRGENHIRVNGENGSGKSTLLNVLTGYLQPDEGNVTIGENVKVGYFSQEVMGLKANASIVSQFLNKDWNKTALFREAKTMGLKPSDLRKKPPELSRGQRAKAAFLDLVFSGFELLVLDEPTNHLDLQTRERIEEALQLYEGAIVFASHDEYFVENIGVDNEFCLEDSRLHKQ